MILTSGAELEARGADRHRQIDASSGVTRGGQYRGPRWRDRFVIPDRERLKQTGIVVDDE